MQLRIDVQQLGDQHQSAVRVVSHKEDPYAGLKGHEYIRARNLNSPVKKLVQTSAQDSDSEAAK
jgi:hypothetical protein